PLTLANIVKNRDLPLGLHDAAEPPEIRKRSAHAALAVPAILGTVGAVDDATRRPDDRRRQVLGRCLGQSRRGRHVLSTGPRRQLALAETGGLHERQRLLSHFVSSLLLLRRV